MTLLIRGSVTSNLPSPLRRILGAATITCVGIGAAVGSGIFATPGDIAQRIRSPWLFLLVWLVAGLITLMQSLVTAELATRFPQAGGEYQYLKEAYGPFAAFFFGWSATIFIGGGGAATIAAALGGFTAELLGIQHTQPQAAPIFGCAALVFIVAVNLLGLRAGAGFQNLLTVLKVLALVGIAAGLMMAAQRVTPALAPPATGSADSAGLTISAFLPALLFAFWAYSGTTDCARLAEEVRDARRSLPRALVGSTLLVTLIYFAFNYALLCAMPPAEMVGHRSVAAHAFEVAGLGAPRGFTLLISILVCLGSIGSCLLSDVRIPYALARDRLAFRFLAGISPEQTPVGALIATGAIACAFTFFRSFGQILQIYFLASAFLFSLTYAALIVFRIRDRRAGQTADPGVYRVPGGIGLAVFLILLELFVAGGIIRNDLRRGGHDSLWTLAILAALIVLYQFWRSRARSEPRP